MGKMKTIKIIELETYQMYQEHFPDLEVATNDILNKLKKSQENDLRSIVGSYLLEDSIKNNRDPIAEIHSILFADRENRENLEGVDTVQMAQEEFLNITDELIDHVRLKMDEDQGRILMDYYKNNQKYLPELNHATDLVLSQLFWSYEKFMKKGMVYDFRWSGGGNKSIGELVETGSEIPEYSTIGDWLNEYNYENKNGISKYSDELKKITSEYFERVYKNTVEKWSPGLHKELELARGEFINHFASLSIKLLENRRIIE